MENKRPIIIAIIVIVVVILGIVIYYQGGLNKAPQQPGATTAGQPASAPSGTAAPAFSPTKAEAPKNVKVPELGEKPPEGVAAPISVAPAAPGASSKLRDFEIKAEKDAYNPSTVIVKKGDTIMIKLTSVDKTYDITLPDYGIKQTAKKGETKILGFQAVNEGKFTYYCSLCGGLDTKTKGYIIVTP